MLELAIRAGLPLIQAQTTDTLNVAEVLRVLSGGVTFVEAVPTQANIKKHKFIVSTSPDKYELNMKDLFHSAVAAQGTVIFLNIGWTEASLFDAGEVPVPKVLVADLLAQVTTDEMVPVLMPMLGGLTIKDVGEIIRLCHARYGALTPEGVVEIRRMLSGQLQGLTPVDLSTPFYFANPRLAKWWKDNRRWFLNGGDARLRPRGLLLHGPSGTGKTQGAKALCREWGIPLYRLDLGATMSKYVGESEANMSAALRQVEIEEPCGLLLDEVEKVFQAGSEDSGVSTRMLSGLLWWLQEHRSRVVTIMTTNNMDALPPELYRPGRIDESLLMQGLTEKEASKFIDHLIDTFQLGGHPGWVGLHMGILAEHYQDAATASHARITQSVYDCVKTLIEVDEGG